MLLVINSLRAQKSLEISKIITVQNQSSDLIYQRVKQWFAKTYNNSNAVNRYDDGNSQIIGKGNFFVNVKGAGFTIASGYVNYTIDIRIKEGRLKLVMNGFSHDSADPKAGWYHKLGVVYDSLPSNDQLKNLGFKGFYKKNYTQMYKYIRPACDDNFELICNSIESYLKEEEKKKDNDDW